MDPIKKASRPASRRRYLAAARPPRAAAELTSYAYKAGSNGGGNSIWVDKYKHAIGYTRFNDLLEEETKFE